MITNLSHTLYSHFNTTRSIKTILSILNTTGMDSKATISPLGNVQRLSSSTLQNQHQYNYEHILWKSLKTFLKGTSGGFPLKNPSMD